MNLFEALAVLVLQRVPFVNSIPFIANAGTIDAAIASLNTAVTRLETVSTRQANESKLQREIAAAATKAADEAEALAAKAARVAKNIGTLVA